MKVLFLDVDGVLNCSATWRLNDGQKGTYRICPERAARLTALLADVNPTVVMSSTWRKYPDHMDYLLAKVPALKSHLHRDWRTGSSNSGFRGNEIADWLAEHPECTGYAIVDDDGDMLPSQRKFFVQTSFNTGLLDEHVTKLAALLRWKVE